MNFNMLRRSRCKQLLRRLKLKAKRDLGSHLWARYRATPPGHPHVCHVCGRGDVRLYRGYGGFLHEDEIRCNAHLTTTGWRVPLICDPRDGGAWGFTSVPEVDVERFFAAPEADPNGPTYRRVGGWEGGVS